MQYDSVLVRYSGEIGIKSKRTARGLLRALVASIKARLRRFGVGFSGVRVRWGRVVIRSSEARRAAEVASKVFGVVSTSPAVSMEADLRTITERALEYAKGLIKPSTSFAVRSRRAGRHPFTSKDVAERVGSAILQAFGGAGVSVDLDSPDAEIFVEVRDDSAYVFHEFFKGLGGLPLGTQGRVVCLISGGLDSSVACYLAMRRGCVPVFVYLDNDPYAAEDTLTRAMDVAKRLCGYAVGHRVRIYVVPHGHVLTRLIEACDRRLTCVLCHRAMLRVAEEIARLEGADAVVTGECIGEQASQTLRNIRVESTALREFPVIRPLAGMDKTEIVRMAKRIGTYEISTRPATCCSVPPKRPAIRADLSEVLEAEENVDVASLVKWDVENARVIRIGA